MIKTAALILILVSGGLCCKAQHAMPSYPDVIRNFASRYKVSEDINNYTNFAKKKEGWYVQQLNREAGDKVIRERLYYSLEKNKYLSLKAYYDTTYLDNPNTIIARLLTSGDWYSYDRIRYYGYDGWFNDMINDFGNAQHLSDTMHDGLGRAYSAKLFNYLWNQTGGFYSGNDSLQVKLKPLQFPSQVRIDSVKVLLEKTMIEFEQLQKLNPNYKTLVGNGTLKLFNEYMFAYMEMQLCGDMNSARAFAARASLQQGHIDQAKNHLNSCAPNAILFTYGDNDTYQLWYIQEILGYRKDVTVINTSMLGLPVYTEVLKASFNLKSSVPAKFLNDEGAAVAYYREGKSAVSTGKPVQAFLQTIYSKKDSVPSRTQEGKVISYALYADTAAYFSVQDAAHKPVKLRFAIKKVLYQNDIIMLDIINSNINTRSVCFTSPETMFGDNLLLSGVNYRLVPENIDSDEQQKKEVLATEKFIKETYMPVLSDSAFACMDGDGSFITLHGRMLGYYTAKNDTANMKKWADKFYTAWHAVKRPSNTALMPFGFYFIEAGYRARGKEMMEEVADKMYMQHAASDATEQYFSLEYCKSKIAGMRDYLSSKNMSSKKLNELSSKLEDEEAMYESD